jgi:hypothetical protein
MGWLMGCGVLVGSFLERADVTGSVIPGRTSSPGRSRILPAIEAVCTDPESRLLTSTRRVSRVRLPALCGVHAEDQP